MIIVNTSDGVIEGTSEARTCGVMDGSATGFVVGSRRVGGLVGNMVG